MSDLVSRFLSFEEVMGRSLVRFFYYVLLFILVVTTLYDMVVTLMGFFSPQVLKNLGRFFVLIPVMFGLKLLALRVGTELVLAILNIEASLQSDDLNADVMSSGLNPVADRPSQPPASKMVVQDEDDGPEDKAVTEEPPMDTPKES